MINKVDFQNLRGSFSKAMGALKPDVKEDTQKYMDKFDSVIKPMVGKYDEVEVLVKLTYKDLKGKVKSSNYRDVQKPFEIPEDAVYYYAVVKLIAKNGDVVLETKDDAPFFKTQAVYVEENLTAKQQETMRKKIKQKVTFSKMASMEQIERLGGGYIKFKPTKTLSV